MSMRVLVTGATGFLGAHLLRRLSGEDVTVAILVRPQSDRWRIRDLCKNFVEIVGDLRYPQDITKAVKVFSPDIVIHLAWSGVLNLYRNDLLQLDNISYSMSLLRIAYEAGCRTWIGLGSQAEYGPLNMRITEDSPTQPSTLYGAAKLCTYLLSKYLCAHFNMRFVWLRLFSAYGPMDDPGWMIPSLILTLLRGERPALTEGVQRWDYLYVTDVADAIFLTMITPNALGVFNLGSGKTYSIRSIAEQIRDLIDPDLPLGFGEIPYRPDQVMHLEADISRLRQATGWTPQINLQEGLRQTVEWFKENRWRYER
jgi:nucleoside-diphosphate-sugar epimerase